MADNQMPMPIPAIGDNSGGLSLAQQISENLAGRHGELVARGRELTGMEIDYPALIPSAAIADKVSEDIRKCTAFEKSVEGVRVAEKEVYLAGGRAVDGFAKTLVDPVSATKASLLRRRTNWDRKVADEERARLRAEAEAAAKRAAELAAEAETEEEIDHAVRAEEEVQVAVQAAKASTADLTRTRTPTGVTTTLRTEWTFELIEPALVPRAYCTPDPRLIRAAVKAAVDGNGDNQLKIPGVRIFKQHVSQVR